MLKLVISLSLLVSSSFAVSEITESNDAYYTCRYWGKTYCPPGKVCAAVVYPVESSASSVAEAKQQAYGNCRAQYYSCSFDSCR